MTGSKERIGRKDPRATALEGAAVVPTDGRRPRADQRQRAREALSEIISKLKQGERLPPEPVLAKTLQTSRATLREALRYFEDEGMLMRLPGAGTFVTERPAIRNDLAVNAGVTELIASHGMRPGAVELEVTRESATAEIAKRLKLRRGTKVWVIDRTRTADGQPVIVSRDVVPLRLLPEGREPLKELGGDSLYALLSERGHSISHGVAWIRPVAADATVAKRLDVKKGKMLLSLVQVDYDTLGSPIMLSYEYHLPDVFEVTVLRRRAR